MTIPWRLFYTSIKLNVLKHFKEQFTRLVHRETFRKSHLDHYLNDIYTTLRIIMSEYAVGI